MAIDRRKLLIGSAAFAAWPRPVDAATRGPPGTLSHFAAARRGTDGRFSAAIIDGAGVDVVSTVLPGRGHDATFCPATRRCVVFARRPGNFAVVLSAGRNSPPLTFTTPDDRHFYGHGAFSRDGRLLYATENDFTAGRGVIGVYDATAQFRRIGEFSTHGVGPHDMAFLNGAPVLVVANGGLREHPDIGGGRRVLNPDQFVASVAYIDCRTGDLLERQVLGSPGAVSMRHLDVGRDDTVIIGAQFHGRMDGPAPAMTYRHRRQSPLAAFALPAEIERRLNGYVSSVAVDRSGRIAAITSSRGGIAILLDIDTGRVLRVQAAHDVSGVAPARTAAEFLLTGGNGAVQCIGRRPTPEAALTEPTPTPWTWDNHLASEGAVEPA